MSARLLHPGLFSARDNFAARQFYTLDPAVIGPALGAARVAPFTLVRLGHAARHLSAARDRTAATAQ